LHDDSKHEKGSLRHETANMLQSILDFQDQTMTQTMTPISEMLLLPSDTVLDRTTTSQYSINGFKHIFVYASHNSDEEVKDLRILGVIEIKVHMQLPRLVYFV
jgi:CBS domain containing-hemolysin-like protein